MRFLPLTQHPVDAIDPNVAVKLLDGPVVFDLVADVNQGDYIGYGWNILQELAANAVDSSLTPYKV